MVNNKLNKDIDMDTYDVSETIKTYYKCEEVRWINPGDFITEDHNPNRINLVLDEAGRITHTYKG